MKTKFFLFLLAFYASIGSLLADSGTCGDNVTWDLTDSVLTISGTGPMANYNYNYDDVPWFSYRSLITSVIIRDGVTSIGQFAFYDCTSLTSVTIPNSVTSIGEYAFCLCTGIISVTIPNSITSIGQFAFWGCTSLTSVTIPNSVIIISQFAFRGCTGLTYISIPNSVTSIGQAAFAGCTSLTSVVSDAETPPTLGISVFENTNNCSIYVPCGTLDIYKRAWSSYSSRIKYKPLEYTITITPSENGNVETPINICDSTLVATPNYGYHFVQWSDGDITNPRTVELTQDTSLFAIFAKNSYTITTATNNSEWGTTTGDANVLYQEQLVIEATPNYGYHFVRWNDGSRVNPRSIIATKDIKYTATFAKNKYIITMLAYSLQGTISGPSQAEYLDVVTLSATPKYGYHFVQWSDGDMTNPRTVVLTQDTAFTAEFAKNTYIVQLSCDETVGQVSGSGSYEYLDTVELNVSLIYGYHFVQWSDGNTENPRTIVLTQDTTLTAELVKNIYTITDNSDAIQGYIEGAGKHEYLDSITLTAIPNYGYHFVQWSDGNTENTQTLVLTQDTTFTAEFAIDKIGTCGKDSALNWSYEDKSKTLTITGEGELTENYTFGVEAPTQMKILIISNDVTSIGDSAFYGMTTINHLTIGGNVASIGNYAFAECKNFDDITCHAQTVPTINATTFANVGNKQYIYLYVPEDRERAYKRDVNWGQFDVQIQKAETTTTDGNVQITPSDNTAEITWPSVDNAETYEIVITKDGEVVCTLIFNANGQLTGIEFAPGRNGVNHTQHAQTAGFKFTVTGLNSGTNYGYVIDSKNSNGVTIDSKSGSFTTTGGEQALEEIGTPSTIHKILRNGQILILRGDKTYTLTGQEVR